MFRSVESLGAIPPRKLLVGLVSMSAVVLMLVMMGLSSQFQGTLASALRTGTGLSPEEATASQVPIPGTAEPQPPIETPLPEEPPSVLAVAPQIPMGYAPTCGGDEHAAARKVWLDADARYSHLMDDKFTIAILTYQRPDILNITLTTLLSTPIPSLLEIVVIDNDLNNTNRSLLPDWVSTSPIPVRHRFSTRNSLNERFFPDPLYKTQAILSHDDDVWYSPSDLEYAFQAWRQLGRYRITGALPRCHTPDKNGKLVYHQCKEGSDWYSLVITNLAFVHISLMDYYMSSEHIPTQIRAHVDEKFNCEDIGMNYVASMLTCTGPLHVSGNEHYHNQNPRVGISRGGGHIQKRNYCLNYFKEVVGFLPLVKQMGGIKRGLEHFA